MAKKYRRCGTDFVSLEKIHKVQVLHSKGYSNVKIAEILGLPEVTVANINTVDERS